VSPGAQVGQHPLSQVRLQKVKDIRKLVYHTIVIRIQHTIDLIPERVAPPGGAGFIHLYQIEICSCIKVEYNIKAWWFHFHKLKKGHKIINITIIVIIIFSLSFSQ
jgi:hypothetical protein